MAQQLWGTSISIGGSSAVTATGSAAAHTTINFTNATLVAGGEADAEYLLSAQTDSGSFVLAALSAGQPNVPLQLVAALRAGKIVLSVAAVGEAAEGASVSVTGYTSAAAAAARPATAAAAAATPATPKRKSEETPTKQQPSKKQKVESEDEEDDEEEEEAPKAKAKPSKPAIVTLKNGLKMQDTKIGTGKEATDKSAVGIRYRGSLASNGKVFDSNMPRGQPLRFKIGGGDVIAGFEQGTKGMRIGGTRTVVIPAHLGYGARGAPPDIPGGATLVFDLELVSVK